ncbi:MAG: hypothetical protein GX895_00105 [Clostridiales bacterium]|uniref:hypothetical protein n=1 Tax=Clostridium sp. N3C TaxID=1776758 RepID=UPI00092E1EAE|nr:hypothetical protein [Clostridium sp. N3C]NLZ47189.1 hypothetical protein [Clostridiales bacterium]SCN25814.1 hypothetical protein N3C_2535 [Clostridium sp. N3C]
MAEFCEIVFDRGLNNLETIVKLIVTIILVLALLFGYSIIQLKIFARVDYLFFVASSLSFLPIFAVILATEYIYDSIQEKDLQDYKTKPSRRRKIVKTIGLIAFIGVIYLGITNYSIVYKYGIKVASPISPAGVVYKYSDISKVKVMVKRTFDFSYVVSYKVIFSNGDSAELNHGGLVESKEENHEDILLKLDQQLKELGVEKEVNKKNFDKFASGLDKDFVSKMEKLFD